MSVGVTSETLKAKSEGSIRLAFTGLLQLRDLYVSHTRGTGTPKDRDEVKRREV
jgi:hypothetical protein